jgi:hypothetical protein
MQTTNTPIIAVRPKFADPLAVTDRSLDVPLHFGKHRGLTLREIAADDVAYLDYLASLKDLDPSLRPAVELACKKYGREIERALR